jgi:PadR family transcriptional regulator, regulatory protein PadR
MMGRSYLGELELMVLLAVVRLGEEAYGVPISKELLILANRPHVAV